jgi:hypothetical protein
VLFASTPFRAAPKRRLHPFGLSAADADKTLFAQELKRPDLSSSSLAKDMEKMYNETNIILGSQSWKITHTTIFLRCPI